MSSRSVLIIYGPDVVLVVESVVAVGDILVEVDKPISRLICFRQKPGSQLPHGKPADFPVPNSPMLFSGNIPCVRAMSGYFSIDLMLISGYKIVARSVAGGWIEAPLSLCGEQGGKEREKRKTPGE